MTYRKKVNEIAEKMAAAAIPGFNNLSSTAKLKYIVAYAAEAEMVVAELAQAYRDGYTVMYCHSRIVNKLSAKWNKNLQEDLKERGLIEN